MPPNRSIQADNRATAAPHHLPLNGLLGDFFRAQGAFHGDAHPGRQLARFQRCRRAASTPPPGRPTLLCWLPMVRWLFESKRGREKAPKRLRAVPWPVVMLTVSLQGTVAGGLYSSGLIG